MDVDIGYILNKNFWGRTLFLSDLLLISSVFLLTGFTVSTFLNNHMTRDLDRSKKKIVIFFEVLAEALVTIIFVVLALYFIPQLPSIIPNASEKHLIQRIKAKDFLLTFAVISCQSKFQNKIRFLLNDDDDAAEIINEEIREDFTNCPNNGAGFVCVP